MFDWLRNYILGCPFRKVCRLYRKDSYTCNRGCGSGCGHYRTLDDSRRNKSTEKIAEFGQMLKQLQKQHVIGTHLDQKNDIAIVHFDKLVLSFKASESHISTVEEIQ